MENPDPERLLCNQDLSKRIKFTDFKKKIKNIAEVLVVLPERVISGNIARN